MFERLPVRLTYTRAEYLSDAVVHVLGVIAAAAAVPALIVTAVLTDGESGKVAGAAIYGATFVLMILCSALYNMIPHPDWEWLLKRLDHSAIYLKIAGTFTAFALIAGQGWWLVSGLWAAAGAGVSLKLYAPERFKLFGICLYLGMGWFGAVLGWSLFAALPVVVVALIASGGGLYTAGVMFYLWNRLPHHMAIWHVFVLTASLTIYAAVALAVLS